jgi:hypothetical protein
VPIAIDYEAGQNRNGCRSGDHEVPTHSRLSRLQFVVTRSRNDRQGCNVAATTRVRAARRMPAGRVRGSALMQPSALPRRPPP